MNKEVYTWVRENLPQTFNTVVEIGSRDINGSLRSLFTGKNYTGVDILPGKNVDIVADASLELPLAKDSFDLAVCVAVFEHTPDMANIILNTAAALRPGGTMLLMAAYSWPPHSAIDGDRRLHPGEHYANIAPKEMESALAAAALSNWKVTTVGPNVYGIAIK